jgi:hypothetical protein
MSRLLTQSTPRCWPHFIVKSVCPRRNVYSCPRGLFSSHQASIQFYCVCGLDCSRLFQRFRAHKLLVPCLNKLWISLPKIIHYSSESGGKFDFRRRGLVSRPPRGSSSHAGQGELIGGLSAGRPKRRVLVFYQCQFGRWQPPTCHRIPLSLRERGEFNS